MSAIGKTFKVSLDMKQPTAQRNEWEVVEGDNGNVIEITLTDDGTPVDLSSCKVLAVFGLPTGQTVEQDTDEGSVTIGGTDHNVITIALKTGSFSPGKAASGLMKCEIQVYSGSDLDVLVTSAQFTFRCRRAIINDETIAATDDYPILVELINEVQQLVTGQQSDWNEADPTAIPYIKNKPATMPPSSHNHGRIDSNGRTSTTYSHEAGDWLMVADYSDSGRIMRTDITFGNATNKWLRNDGSWTAPNASDVDAIPTTEKGAAAGVATLDTNGKVNADEASSSIVMITESKTLELSDAGKMLVVYSSSAVTITIPNHTSVDLPVGTEIEVLRWGSGAVNIAPGTNVGLWAPGASSSVTHSIDGDNGVAALKFIQTNGNGADNWIITGNVQ